MAKGPDSLPFKTLRAVDDAVPEGYSKLAETVLDQLAEQLDDCIVYTTIFEATDNVYRIIAVRGDEQFGGGFTGMELPLDRTYCFQMATDRAPRLALNAPQDPVYSEIDPGRMFGTYAGSPIELSDGTRVGSLCVMSRKTDAVDPSIVPMLSILAGTLAGALEREQQVERLKAANAELREQASTDSLTGLANRRAFEVELLRSWQLARRGTMASYLFVADIDEFKLLNDEQGHLVGDLVLIELADSLVATARDSDVVGRVGGDEFSVILQGCESDAEADAFCGRVDRELKARVDKRDLTCLVSLGFADLGAAPSPERAAEEADLAMYEAKRGARGD